jgi:hypothetical protein
VLRRFLPSSRTSCLRGKSLGITKRDANAEKQITAKARRTRKRQREGRKRGQEGFSCEIQFRTTFLGILWKPFLTPFFLDRCEISLRGRGLRGGVYVKN